LRPRIVAAVDSEARQNWLMAVGGCLQWGESRGPL